MTLNRAPVLKELILDGVHNEHILSYLSLEADQLEKLDISYQCGKWFPVHPDSPSIPTFPSLRHIRYDLSTGHELIPYLLESSPNLFTLLVSLEVHRESTFFVEDLTWWLAPRRDGNIPAPYLKALHVKVTGSRYYSRRTRSSVLESVNTVLSARKKAGAGQSPNITISWEDDSGEQLCWEDGQLVLPSDAPPEDAQRRLVW
jgi:hypothetical protein